MQDPDVTKRSGIYTYLLTGDERHLSSRKFDDREIRAAYERQKHKCGNGNGSRCRTPGSADVDGYFLYWRCIVWLSTACQALAWFKPVQPTLVVHCCEARSAAFGLL